MVILLEIKEIRKMSNEELTKKIKETKEDLFQKRMQQANGTLDKPTVLRTLRRDIAKMKTVLNEREVGGNK